MIGATISHYKILSKLGEGGMGVVYKAHDTSLDRDVALKFLPHYLTSDATEKERFYHEAKAAASLTHSNIAVVYEIGELDSQVFIAMELVEGRTLRDLVCEAQSSPLPMIKVLDMAIQCCEGLSAAHEKGIVHRDIKSENIMVSPKGIVKIMDFGLAKLMGATKLTKAGSTLGTAAYMSPEQARGEEVDHRSDIFSLGVVLYELLAGRLPFRGDHPAALAYAIINEQPQPVARFNEQATPELEYIVLKALEKNREDRYQHVEELLADVRRERKKLEYARAGYATAVTVSALPARPRWRSLKLIALAAAILVLAGLALILNPFNLQVGIQQNAAAQQQSLAVMSFENIPDPDDKDYTGEMLTNLLITALVETRDVEVISRERLYDIQQEMGQGDKKTISSSAASQIARRAGVTTMLLGSIVQLRPAVTVTYRVVDVESGRIVSTKRVSGYPSDSLFPLVDALAQMVKKDLNVPSQAADSAKSVVEVTTRSPEAYRAYVEGVELSRKFLTYESWGAFRKAIDLDSNFAMAHYYLGAVGLSREEIIKAFELRNGVTEKERLQIEARYATRIQRSPAKAAEMLDQLLRQYPHEQRVYVELSNLYSLYLCDYDRAIGVCERGLHTDPADKESWNQLAYLYAGLGKRTEALHAVDRYVELAPAEINPYDTKGDVFLAFGETDSASYWWRKGLEFGGWYTARKLAYQAVLRRDFAGAVNYLRRSGETANQEPRTWAERDAEYISMNQGKLVQARERLEGYLRRDLENETFRSLVIHEYAILVSLAYELGDYAAMVRFARDLNARPPVNAKDVVAWALLKNGGDEEAARLLAEFRAEQMPGLIQGDAEYEYYAGLCAFERGEFNAALAQFEKSFSRLPPIHAPDYYVAVAFLKCGRIPEAIKEFHRLTWWSFGAFGPVHIETDFLATKRSWAIAAVKAHYWLGIGYEQQGRRDEAAKEYETFLDQWKDADFTSPEMKDARARLANMKRTSSP